MLNTWRSPSAGVLSHFPPLQPRDRGNIISHRQGAHPYFRRKMKTVSFSTFTCLGTGIDTIAEIAHNKVLVAAAVSSAIGQVLKFSTKAILYGKFDFKVAFQAGGFPSTHSSAAVATATALGLERGFSDAIFGLAVVYAGITMYDAQGVRREVGIHAKALNRVFSNTKLNSIPSDDADRLVDSSSGKPSLKSGSLEPLFFDEQSSFMKKQQNTSLLLKSDKGGRQSTQMLIPPLKESIGHTEIEVIAGALLGLCVSLAVCNSTV